MIDCIVINLRRIKAVETHESWGLVMRMENCDQIHLHCQELEAAAVMLLYGGNAWVGWSSYGDLVLVV